MAEKACHAVTCATQFGLTQALDARMKPIEFETYCFLRLYSVDLDTALKAIPVLRRYRRGDVQVALLRDIAVTYARPFSLNRGKLINKHQLPIKHVPLKFRPLHARLIQLRNSQFAHSDLKFHNPKVANLGTSSNPLYAMSLKSFDYGLLLRELPDISQLIKSVANSVNRAVTAYQARI